ncbi:hypothetical protein L484_007456 [Morus notabilis]|uniref:DUF3511 domain-containing protein n=1 Tax=Morus notabilis TaxID=981085 RepID=W9SA16_9ROSA|nr:hypothetical protein L484_007456 [Morus notabilis]
MEGFGLGCENSSTPSKNLKTKTTESVIAASGNGRVRVGLTVRRMRPQTRDRSGNRAHSPDPGPDPPRASQASRGDSKPWSFSDPEAKRKKRIYKYKAYTVEGKVKASLRKGLRWIKNKCSEIVRGY